MIQKVLLPWEVNSWATRQHWWVLPSSDLPELFEGEVAESTGAVGYASGRAVELCPAGGGRTITRRGAGQLACRQPRKGSQLC